MPAIDIWLQIARADVVRQGHVDALPVLDALAQAAAALRRADWNADASGQPPSVGASTAAPVEEPHD
jgi:hypothetical protein